VVLLVVFLHHVSLMVQVSHVAANIAHATLARTDVLYPEDYDEGRASDRAGELLKSWRSDESGWLLAPRPGYVQRVDLDAISDALVGRVERIAVLACPGDFVGVETPLMEIWPARAAEDGRNELLRGISIASERDLNQDVAFGVRQLADTAIRAMSPGINDPATAVTCIAYLRAILTRLTERAPAAAMRSIPDRKVALIVRQRQFDEYLEAIFQLNRYVGTDAWVIGELLQVLKACGQTAQRCGAPARMREVRLTAMTIADQAIDRIENERDLASINCLRAEIAVNGDV
jgi:uncharacterized membrane protein